MAYGEVFSGNGTRVVKTPVRSPRANSYADRFVGTLLGECLDHVLILWERNLRSVLAEYIRHYNGHRPHQALRQEPPLCEPGNGVDITARIERRQVLGGLISEYRRAMLNCMSAQHHRPRVTDRPAETPAAIRATLAASDVPEVLAQYESELDAAFAQARETGDLTVLTTAVRRWWIEALEWQRDPAGQRDFLARMERYLAEGPPGPEHRITCEEFRAQLGV
jgi:Family of unknown function (DUF6247)/Integrase core domain